MIELLLASGLSCASSQELLNRVNEYALRGTMPEEHIQEVIDIIKKTTRSVLMKDQNQILTAKVNKTSGIVVLIFHRVCNQTILLASCLNDCAIMN